MREATIELYGPARLPSARLAGRVERREQRAGDAAAELLEANVKNLARIAFAAALAAASLVDTAAGAAAAKPHAVPTSYDCTVTDVDVVEVLVDLTQAGPLAVGMKVDVYFQPEGH